MYNFISKKALSKIAATNMLLGVDHDAIRAEVAKFDLALQEQHFCEKMASVSDILRIRINVIKKVADNNRDADLSGLMKELRKLQTFISELKYIDSAYSQVVGTLTALQLEVFIDRLDDLERRVYEH